MAIGSRMGIVDNYSVCDNIDPIKTDYFLHHNREDTWMGFDEDCDLERNPR